jgi:putative transposase
VELSGVCFPLISHQTVYYHFRIWKQRGVWQEALHAINRKHRKQDDRDETPSYGIIDSQSVKTVYASENRGIDGNKKIKGRKRHIVVDSQGHLLHVIVHAANDSDTKAGCLVLEETAEKYPSIEAFSGDAGYKGTAVYFVNDTLNLTLHISEKLSEGFSVLPKRWIVERTFAWLGTFRRLFKDVEILADTAEAMIQIAMLKLTLAKCV